MKGVLIANVLVLGFSVGILFILWRLLGALETLNRASAEEAAKLQALWEKITSELRRPEKLP